MVDDRGSMVSGNSARFLKEFGIQIAGKDEGEGNAEVGCLGAEGAVKPEDERLGGGEGSGARLKGVGDDGSDVDDVSTATFDHGRVNKLDGIDCAENIGVEDLDPIFGFEVLSLAENIDAGGVYEEVDMTVVGIDAIDDSDELGA